MNYHLFERLGENMKSPIAFCTAVARTKRKLNRAMVQGLTLKKPVRTRPRTEEEKVALCRAVVYSVAEAKRSGRLQKTEKGYRLLWNV